jgi:hypothetical protein
MENLVSGMLLPCGEGVMPEPVIVNGLDSLNMMVGGTIDAVTTTLDSDTAVLVGYINDEGLFLDMEFNYIASALFNRHIVGNCVVVWGLNSNGVYDGESYDLPSAIVKFLNEELMQVVAKGYGTATILGAFCEVAIDLGLATHEDINYHSEQLMLSAQFGTKDAEHDAHIDYFINMIKAVMAEAGDAELDDELSSWADIVLADLHERKGS